MRKACGPTAFVSLDAGVYTTLGCDSPFTSLCDTCRTASGLYLLPESLNPAPVEMSAHTKAVWRSPMRITMKNRALRAVLGVLISGAALTLAACDVHTVPSAPGSGGVPVPGPTGPSLGAAQSYGILAGSTITCVGPVGTISADLGLWPGSAVTGFPTCTVSGIQNMANATAQTAQGALTVAYNSLAGRACGTTISANLRGTTLAPGVYCSTSSAGLTGTVTLDGQGNTNATFVIQIASALTVAGSVDLIGGC